MSDNPGPRIFVADLVEEHYEELAFLIGERQAALRSSLYNLADLHHLDERIAAQIAALLVGPEQAGAAGEKLLKDKDPAFAAAAAMVLLRLSDPHATAAAIAAFERAADEETLSALCVAFERSPLDNCVEAMRKFVADAGGNPRLAAAAAAILGTHGLRDSHAALLKTLSSDENPFVRAAAWRAFTITS